MLSVQHNTIYERNALLTPNIITKKPTFFMTFRNTVLKLWSAYSNVDDADIFIFVMKIVMLLCYSFIVRFLLLSLTSSCYRMCSLFFEPLADTVMPGRLEPFPSFSLSQPAISPKPFCVLFRELSRLSHATPLPDIAAVSLCSVFTFYTVAFVPSLHLFVSALRRQTQK